MNEKESLLNRTGFTCVFCGVEKKSLDENGLQISIMSTWNSGGLSGYMCSDCVSKEPFYSISKTVTEKMKGDL